MRWWALCATAAVSGSLVAACGLDLVGLGDAADGGVDAPSGDAVIWAEGGGEGATGADAPAGGEAGGDATTESGGGEAGVDALAEAGNEASPPVDAGCPGVLCNGACTTGSDCHACSGATLLCASSNSCGADCTACPASPIACFACDATRRNPIGTCQPDNGQSYCLDTNYAGAYQGGDGEHCACNVATDCPGETQVCIPVGGSTVFGCFTCGESFTQAAQCASGGNCNAQQAKCN